MHVVSYPYRENYRSNEFDIPHYSSKTRCRQWTALIAIGVINTTCCCCTDMFPEGRHNHGDAGGGWRMVGGNIAWSHWMVSQQLRPVT